MTVPSSLGTAYPKPPVDPRERMRAFLANRPNFPNEEWLRYIDEWVAFSWDGKAILAHAADLESLEQRLVQAGIDPQDVGFEFVHTGDISDTGGAGIEIEQSPEPPETT